MRAGLLRQRLALLRVSAVKDGQGGETRTWTTKTTVWGQLVPVNALERLIVQQQTGEVTHDWQVRYSSAVADLSVKDRWSWGGRVFEILTVLNEEARNRMLYGTAKEVAA